METVLEEREAEPGEKTGRERCGLNDLVQSFGSHPEDTEEDAAPGGELPGKQVDPLVEGGNSDLPPGAEGTDCTGPIQICFQDSQDKAQGIGTIRDEDIRKDGV